MPSRALGRIRDLPERRERELASPRSLATQPILECLARVADVKAVEQLAAIERDGVIVMTLGDRGPQRDHVAPEFGAVEFDLVVATAHEDIVADREPKLVEGVAERAPGRELIELGPEDGQQAVASIVRIGADGEIGQKRQPLWLREEPVGIGPVGARKLGRPEEFETDHGGHYLIVCGGAQQARDPEHLVHAVPETSDRQRGRQQADGALVPCTPVTALERGRMRTLLILVVIAAACRAQPERDSCGSLAPSEAEPYVGPLGTPPYRYDDAAAMPDPAGDACMYHGRDGRSVVVTVSRGAGAAEVGKIVTDAPKVLARAMAAGSGGNAQSPNALTSLLSGPPGPWDRSMWSPMGTLTVWKGDAQIMVDVSGSEAGQPGAIDLATKIVGRLDHPLDYDGAHAATLAPKPHEKLANACDLIPRARAEQILGPLDGSPIADPDGTECTYKVKGAGDPQTYPMSVTWRGGYQALDRLKHTLPMSSGILGTPKISMPTLDSSSQKLLGGLMKMVGGSATGAPVKTSFKTDTTLRGPWDAAALINGTVLSATRHDVMVTFELQSADYDKAKALLAAACERL